MLTAVANGSVDKAELVTPDCFAGRPKRRCVDRLPASGAYFHRPLDCHRQGRLRRQQRRCQAATPHGPESETLRFRVFLSFVFKKSTRFFQKCKSMRDVWRCSQERRHEFTESRPAYILVVKRMQPSNLWLIEIAQLYRSAPWLGRTRRIPAFDSSFTCGAAPSSKKIYFTFF